MPRDRTDRMARPRKKQLTDELDRALTELHALEQTKTVASSVALATLMTRIESLRFQLFQRDYDAAITRGETGHAAEQAMHRASLRVAEWEKRKSAAISDLVNDLLLAEQDHNETQDALEQRASKLQ